MLQMERFTRLKLERGGDLADGQLLCSECHAAHLEEFHYGPQV